MDVKILGPIAFLVMFVAFVWSCRRIRKLERVHRIEDQAEGARLPDAGRRERVECGWCRRPIEIPRLACMDPQPDNAHPLGLFFRRDDLFLCTRHCAECYEASRSRTQA